MNEFKQYSEQLLANGYVPLPIKQGQKRPAITDWSTINVTPTMVAAWLSKGLGGCGVGLRGGDLVAIDIDVTDPGIVDALTTWCDKHMGPGMVRIGQSPKTAWFYRTTAPFSRRDSAIYAHNGQPQHIEARGLDSQTVGYGIHPDTHQPYQWLTDNTPLNTPITDLPTISQDQVEQLFDYFKNLVETNRDWPLQAENTGVGDTEGDWMKPKYVIEDADLAVALSYLKADDYHRWVSVGMALFHHYDGGPEGLSLWDSWSSNSPKYTSYEDVSAKWDSFHTTGRRSTATVGSILHLATAAGWSNPGIPVSDTSEFPEVDPDDPLAPYRLGRMLDTPAPPVDWLIPNFIPAHKVCLLTAPGGTGKSLWTFQLAVSVASGVPLSSHWKNVTSGGVLMLTAEDDTDDIHRRLEAIYNSFADDFSYTEADLTQLRQAVNTHLFSISMVGKNARLTHKDGNECVPTGAVDKLIAFAGAIPDLKLILIDPVSRFRGGDENSQEDVTRFVEQLERVRMATGATILAVHHANKASMREGGADMQYAARGASALTDGVRFQMNMANLHPDDAHNHGINPKEAGQYVMLAVAKTNYTAPQGHIWLTRGLGGVLTHVELDKLKAIQTAEERHISEVAILNIVQRYQDQDDPITRNRLRREYGGKEGEVGLAVNRITSLIDLMVLEGRLQEVPKAGAGGGKILLTSEDEDDE